MCPSPLIVRNVRGGGMARETKLRAENRSPSVPLTDVNIREHADEDDSDESFDQPFSSLAWIW